jgi:hypothetical protein
METVAFNSIGFHAAMILNRLVNERQIKERDTRNDCPRDKDDSADKKQRAELADIEGQNKRLRAEALRVREEPTT